MKRTKNTLKKAIGLTIVISILLSIMSVASFAVDTEPVIQSVSMDETRTYITLRFDREISATTTSFYGKIRLSKGGASLATLPSNTVVSVSGYNMYIKLTTALSTSSNYFSIAAGVLDGQSNVIESPLFDARGPELAETNSISLYPDEKIVKIKFSTPIKGYPDNESLKNGYIALARNGSSFNEIIPEDDIEINGENGEISIYLDTWLSGNYSRFRITAGKIQNSKTGNINLADITTERIDATKSSASPEFDYATITDDRKTVTLYFTDRIKNSFTTGVSSSTATSLLKSHILVSRGGTSNYKTLSGTDTLTVGSNYVRITFSESLTSSRNYVKIESDSLTDYYGNYIKGDIVTDNITSGTSSATAPTIASTYLASNNKIVIYFTTSIKMSADVTLSELKSMIYVSRNGGSYERLSSSESVTFSGSMLTITLREALYGSNNRVKIGAGAISSTAGVKLASTVTTTALTAGMSSDDSDDDDYSYYEYPEYASITYDSSASRVRIYFENDIRKVSSISLLECISLSRNGGEYNYLSSSDIVTISPSNAITILLSEPLQGSNNRFRIASGSLSDYESGYVLNKTITTDSISASGTTSSSGTSSSSTSYSGNVTATISSDLYSITLKFNEKLYNSYDSLEDLKDKIQISRSNTFRTLSSDDYIRIDSESNELLIVLADPASEYFSQIKILSGALRTADGSSISTTITTLPLGEALGDPRLYVNDRAKANVITSSTDGTSTNVSLSSTENLSISSGAELLVKVPSTSTSATLTVPSSVINSLKSYNAKIGLSLGNVTYVVPAKSITSSSDFTISLSDSDYSVDQKLSSASSKQSFVTEAAANNFSANSVSFDNAFAEKRFMIANPKTATAFTAVRIENSGTIVPVPSAAEVKGGVVYLTALTKRNGNYAAISASHSFVNTPNWVSGPVNTLASRLILTNTTGTDIKSSEAISRSETVEIMARTLGILYDCNSASKFFDIISTDSFFGSVMSTVEYGLISGYPDSTFKPSNKLTRAEAMTIVARAMRFIKGESVETSSNMSVSEATNILSKFSDASNVDTWAKVNIAECVQAGIVNGDNNNRLNPKANVTRAELIQLMYNILEYADCL